MAQEVDGHSMMSMGARRVMNEHVQSIVDDIKDAIKSGEVTTHDELDDRLHEGCDSAIIYYVDQYAIVLAGDDNDAEELGATDWQGMLAERAYTMLRAAVQRHLEAWDIVDRYGEPILPPEPITFDGKPIQPGFYADYANGWPHVLNKIVELLGDNNPDLVSFIMGAIDDDESDRGSADQLHMYDDEALDALNDLTENGCWEYDGEAGGLMLVQLDRNGDAVEDNA